MALFDVLCGRKPLLKSTEHNRRVREIEQDFAKLLNSRSTPNYRYTPDGSPLAMQLAAQVASVPDRPIDPSKIPAGAKLSVFGPVIGPPAVGQVTVIYNVPLTQHFLLTQAYMAGNNGAPPPVGGGMDFVPLDRPQNKQTIGGVGDTSHLEGVYIIEPIPEGTAWTGNQVSIYRGAPILIPAGSVIRCIRNTDSVANTMSGTVCGYLINIDGSDTNPPDVKPPGGPYYLPSAQ